MNYQQTSDKVTELRNETTINSISPDRQNVLLQNILDFSAQEISLDIFPKMSPSGDVYKTAIYARLTNGLDKLQASDYIILLREVTRSNDLNRQKHQRRYFSKNIFPTSREIVSETIPTQYFDKENIFYSVFPPVTANFTGEGSPGGDLLLWDLEREQLDSLIKISGKNGERVRFYGQNHSEKIDKKIPVRMQIKIAILRGRKIIAESRNFSTLYRNVNSGLVEIK